jgi:benzoyl-CoA 2,3-dioxygenase component B
MSSVSLEGKIPNNVDLASDKRLQRALEQWQPGFLDWWREMGPDGFQANDVYPGRPSQWTRGWANFGMVRMPDYRWNFLADPPPRARSGSATAGSLSGEVPGDTERGSAV